MRALNPCLHLDGHGAPASKKKTRVDFFDKAKLTYLIRNVSKYSNITSPGCLTPKFYAFEMMLDI